MGSGWSQVSLPAKRLFLLLVKIKMKPYSQTQQPLTLPAPVLSFTYDLLPNWPSLTHKEIPQVRKLWARDILPIFKHIFTGIETARRRLWTVPLSGRWIKGSCWYMFQYCSANQSEHPPLRNELCLLTLASVAPHSLIFMCVGVADVGQ